MQATTDPAAAVRATTLKRLGELETALVAHGYRVEVEARFWEITAIQRAGKLSSVCAAAHSCGRGR